MTDQHEAILEAIKLAAGVEAQRVALQTLQAAQQVGMLPKVDYKVSINIDIKRQTITLAPSVTQ